MRLLLAEDEKSLVKALKAILERNGYTVDTVEDGEAALEYLETGSYDGVIMDWMMPKNVIPTERILEKIWGYESDAEPTVVWAYISYLRKKLTALGADIQIKATRNTG